MYPSAGSHASYYGSALYLGRNGSEGFGCDNTDGPSTRLDPEVVVLPDEPVDDPDDPLAWTAFSGRWGERHDRSVQRAGRALPEDRFLEPMDWQDDLRDVERRSCPPATRQADALVRGFCGVVEWGSNQLLQFKLSPARGFVTLVIVGSAGAVPRPPHLVEARAAAARSCAAAAPARSCVPRSARSAARR